MIKLKTVYEGNLSCKTTHLSSKKTLSTDAPADLGGKGSDFSPTDLVACALVNCIATTMGFYAERKGLDLKGMELEIEKHMTQDAPRRVESLPITIWIKGEFSEEQKASLEKVAQSCPVHKSLHPDIEVTIKFNWLPLESDNFTLFESDLSDDSVV